MFYCYVKALRARGDIEKVLAKSSHSLVTYVRHIFKLLLKEDIISILRVHYKNR
jgi:hypothetical protein